VTAPGHRPAPPRFAASGLALLTALGLLATLLLAALLTRLLRALLPTLLLTRLLLRPLLLAALLLVLIELDRLAALGVLVVLVDLFVGHR
jgi:hypothetical protein